MGQEAPGALSTRVTNGDEPTYEPSERRQVPEAGEGEGWEQLPRRVQVLRN